MPRLPPPQLSTDGSAGRILFGGHHRVNTPKLNNALCNRAFLRNKRVLHCIMSELKVAEKWDTALEKGIKRTAYGAIAGGVVAVLLFRTFCRQFML